MASVERHLPGCRRFVFLADRPPQDFDWSAEPFEVVLSSALPVPGSAWFHFRYSVLELNTAVKPHALEWLLRTGDFDEVLYFDPDILLLAPVDPPPGEITLTPHLLEPLPADGRLPDELTILRAGAYNLGFIAVRRTGDGLAFARWWSEHVRRHCYIDFENGLFTDQRWIDLAPSLFPAVTVVRDPGWNVAYWNVTQRVLEKREDGYYAGGEPLRFFHFSGFDPHQPRRLSKFQTRLRPEDLGPLADLLDSYASRLLASGYDEFRNAPYGYSRFANGTAIPDICRRFSEAVPGIEAQIADPFSGEGFRAFTSYWNAHVWTPQAPERRLTRFACRLHETRAEVGRQFPQPFGADYVAFLEWLLRAGIDEVFLEPIRRLLHLARHRAALEERRVEALAVRQALEKLPPPVQRLARAALPEIHPPQDDASMRAWLTGPCPLDRVILPRIAALIYQERADVREAFPHLGSGGIVGFLRWLLTDGRVEYSLPEPLLAPVREQLEAYVEANVPAAERLRSRTVDLVKSAAVAVGSAVRGGELRRTPAVRVETVAEDGVNVFASSDCRITETLAEALRAAQVPFHRGDGAPYGVNLCVREAAPPGTVFEGRYNIRYFWPEPGVEAPPVFEPFDEIWVPSTGCLDIVSRSSPVPVVRIPPALTLRPPTEGVRHRLGLAAGEFVFLAPGDDPALELECFLRAGVKGSALVVRRWPQSASREGRIVLAGALEIDDLIAACDCVVSFERCAGFALPLAKAMLAGKPVVAAAHAVNLDLCRHWLLAELDAAGEPVRADAIALMRKIASDGALRTQLAARGRDFLAREFSAEAAGRRMAERLRHIRERMAQKHRVRV